MITMRDVYSVTAMAVSHAALGKRSLVVCLPESREALAYKMKSLCPIVKSVDPLLVEIVPEGVAVRPINEGMMLPNTYAGVAYAWTIGDRGPQKVEWRPGQVIQVADVRDFRMIVKKGIGQCWWK